MSGDVLTAGARPTKSGYGHYAKSIGGRSPSLRWPHLFDILVAKGYSKEKAARISNSRVGMRKGGRLEGLPYKQAGSKRALKRVLAEQERKRAKPKAMAAALVAACHDASCAPPPAGSGGSKPGPGRTSVEQYGMRFDPDSERIVAPVRALDEAGKIDWSTAERRTLAPAEISTLHANERDLKQRSIDKVVSGSVPFREGYVVKLYEAPNGDQHIVDGHHRVAMHSALDRPMEVQIYRHSGSFAAQALLAACYGRACAPPPVGAGGSSAGPGGAAGMLSDPKRLAQALIRQTSKGQTVTVTPKELDAVLDSIAGDKAAMLDLGKVHVKGTRLFARMTAKSTIDRSKMPQIPDTHREKFLAKLTAEGIAYGTIKVDPKTLNPTQKDLSGPKVGAITNKLEDGTFTEGAPILVSSDGFILDGHHRWAANVVYSLQKPGVRMDITRIDAPIADVLKIGLDFNKQHGIFSRDIRDVA